MFSKSGGIRLLVIGLPAESATTPAFRVHKGLPELSSPRASRTRFSNARRPLSWILPLLLAAISIPASPAVISVDFEQFTDGDAITNQIPGLTFTNSTVATAGISLNELEFPPHSGVNVAFDNGGPITISFDAPIDQFSGYFTYSVPLSVQAFGSTQQVLTSAASVFTSNLAISGDAGSSPNELLTVNSGLGINQIVISGSSSGSSFVMDDLSFRPLATTTPEPGEVPLLYLGLAVLMAIYRCCLGRGEQDGV